MSSDGFYYNKILSPNKPESKGSWINASQVTLDDITPWLRPHGNVTLQMWRHSCLGTLRIWLIRLFDAGSSLPVRWPLRPMAATTFRSPASSAAIGQFVKGDVIGFIFIIIFSVVLWRVYCTSRDFYFKVYIYICSSPWLLLGDVTVMSQRVEALLHKLSLFFFAVSVHVWWDE